MSRRPASLATLLAWVAVAVIAYASLYPFEGWHEAQWSPREWLFSPWPKYWSGFDLWANWLGYMPLGGLWAVAALRRRRGSWWTVGMATAQASALSLAMESIQGFMVHRVSSNLDWGLNTLGAFTGAIVVWWWLSPPRMHRWDRIRGHWLSTDGGVELTLLLLWVLALLVPTALPFSVGRWAPAALDTLHQLIQSWPWGAAVPWVGLPWVLDPMQESGVVALTLVTPMAVAALTVRGRLNRALACCVVLALALLVPMVQAVVAHGWSLAGAWLLPTLPLGFALAALGGLLLVALPRRALTGLALLLLLVQTVVVNLYATTAYWDVNWQQFGQSRFVRMYGVLGWVAVAWPWLALVLLSRRLFVPQRA